MENGQAGGALETAGREPIVAVSALAYVGVAVVGEYYLGLSRRGDEQGGSPKQGLPDDAQMCHSLFDCVYNSYFAAQAILFENITVL